MTLTDIPGLTLEQVECSTVLKVLRVRLLLEMSIPGNCGLRQDRFLDVTFTLERRYMNEHWCGMSIC
jgi:hypothetical protein